MGETEFVKTSDKVRKPQGAGGGAMYVTYCKLYVRMLQEDDCVISSTGL